MNTLLRKLPTIARVLLGLVFFVFGLNGFLHFLPQPPMSGPPALLLGAFVASGYLLPLIKATEVIAGVLLLSGRFVPLALAILAPVLVNIFAFHAALEPSGLGMVFVLLALEIYLSWAYRSAFSPMLRSKAEPAGLRNDNAEAPTREAHAV